MIPTPRHSQRTRPLGGVATRTTVAALTLTASAFSLTGCFTFHVDGGSSSGSSASPDPGQTTAPQPEATTKPSTDGSGFPTGGIPAEARWATDWLEGYAPDGEGVRGDIVSIDLDYEQGAWVWEITSRYPSDDAANPNPGRGYEAELAADTLKELRGREITLDADEQDLPKVSIAEAAKISGEAEPNPRLIELSLDRERGAAVWEATLLDTETGIETELTIDASNGKILKTETD